METAAVSQTEMTANETEDATTMNQETVQAPKKGLSSRCKCCIGCCVCTVVVVLVMILVSIFVIGPNFAQHILDTTEIALPNLTQSACPTKHTWLHNHAKITVPKVGPISPSSTMLPFTQEVYTTYCDKAGTPTPWGQCDEHDEEKEVLVATYVSPSMYVSPGDNLINFSVTTDSNDAQFQNLTDFWVIPLFLLQQPARLILKAKDVTVKANGLTFNSLTMRNELTCIGLPGSFNENMPASVCGEAYPGSPTFVATCVAGKHAPTVTTTTIVTTTTAKDPLTTTTKPAPTVTTTTIATKTTAKFPLTSTTKHASTVTTATVATTTTAKDPPTTTTKHASTVTTTTDKAPLTTTTKHASTVTTTDKDPLTTTTKHAPTVTRTTAKDAIITTTKHAPTVATTTANDPLTTTTKKVEVNRKQAFVIV